ncbi:unnamed protein product, partial [Callosobruchus maculatus]
MESFLGSVVNCTPTLNIENLGTTHDDMDLRLPSPIDDEHITTEDPLIEDTHEDLQTAPNQPQPSREVHPELQQAQHLMSEAFSSLTNVLNKRQAEEDDCDLYGKLIAKKLRRFSEEERVLVMYEIDGIFLQHYSRSSIDENNLASGNNVPSRPSTSHSNYS